MGDTELDEFAKQDASTRHDKGTGAVTDNDGISLTVEYGAGPDDHGLLAYNVVFQLGNLMTTATFRVLITDQGSDFTNKARALAKARRLSNQFSEYRAPDEAMKPRPWPTTYDWSATSEVVWTATEAGQASGRQTFGMLCDAAEFVILRLHPVASTHIAIYPEGSEPLVGIDQIEDACAMLGTDRRGRINLPGWKWGL